jgi:uncharacterized protein (TIGR02996 family)
MAKKSAPKKPAPKKAAPKSAPNKAAPKAAPKKAAPAPNKAAPKESPTKLVAAKPAGRQPSGVDALWAAYWANPADKSLLAVYADALEQAGDPRGKFINLSLLASRTPEQEAAREALMRKSKGDLIGPAKTVVREVYFGSDGLVSHARCEADKVIAGIDLLRTLNPRLVLTITSLKTDKLAKEFGAISLAGIYFVDFGWLISSHGGCRIVDKHLAMMAPAFTETENLQFSINMADNSITPAGLAAFAPYAKKLRFLAADYYPGGTCAKPAEYAPGLRAFPALKAVEWPLMQPSDLPGIKVNVLHGPGADNDMNSMLRQDTAAKVESLF